MSAGVPCTDRNAHRATWYVIARRHNTSTFNGGRYTPSAYSAVRCPECGGIWRTKAAYVRTLPDAPPSWWAR